MTKQEAIKILNKYDLNFCDIDGNPIPPQDLVEAFDMAIEALQHEQERREDIYECPNCLGNYICYPSCGIKEQERLPKHCIVPPSDAVGVPKRGKWVKKEHLVPLARDADPLDWDKYDKKTHSELKEYWHCSECDYEGDRHFRPSWKYCPNCGERME